MESTSLNGLGGNWVDDEHSVSLPVERRWRHLPHGEEYELGEGTMLNRLTSLVSDWLSERSTGPDQPTASESDGGSSGTDGEGRSGGTSLETHSDSVSVSSGETAGERVDAATPWEGLLDQETVSKQDVQIELGLQPHEFLVGLVRYSGGSMWQADVVDTTGWSKSTVSRYLDSLESSGLVERVWIGRRKLVGVPGGMPDSVPSPDGPTISPAADSWSSEDEELA